MYELCIFDLDGTLSNPYEGLCNGIQYAIDKLNLKGSFTDPSQFIGPPLQQSLKEAFGLEPDDIEHTVATFREYYGKTGLYENELYPGISELLQTLKNSGIQLAVATSKPDRFAHKVLEHFGIYEYFDFVIGDTEDGSMSHGGKEMLVRAVLDKLDAERKKTAVMIGDRKHDISGAIAAGIDSIGVLWGYGSADEFETAGATYTAGDVDELSGLLLGK